MAVSVILAPAAAGKTAHLVSEARRLARTPTLAPRVIVPSRLQARAWRERLARAGGALGVHVWTFDDLYADILRSAGIVITLLSDAVQTRLLRALADQAPLALYASVRTTPGFIQVLRDLIGELKAGGVFPEELLTAVAAMGNPPRLAELAQLYAAYQERLRQEGWADYAGIGWLAAETLDHRPEIAGAWPCVMVDGFDDLTTVQLRVLAGLAPRVNHLVITLTGQLEGVPRTLVHKRFNRTLARLQQMLQVGMGSLPAVNTGAAPEIQHLEASLYTAGRDRLPAGERVMLVAVPDREAEVRTALRWLKTHLVRSELCPGLRPGEAALLARSLEPYRAYIDQIGEELGLPIHVVDGLPLRANPAVAAFLDLLQLALPGESSLTWRRTLDAWRSPYFDWERAGAAPLGEPAGPLEAIGVTPEDAEALDRIARWGSVIGGMGQWQEAFALLQAVGAGAEPLDEEASGPPETLPRGAAAGCLWAKFQRFARRLEPPGGGAPHPCRTYVLWIEELVGSDEELDEEESSSSALPLYADLGVLRRARTGLQTLAERDEAALHALKDVLRGLVWAAEAVECAPIDYATFLSDLLAAVEVATYRVPPASETEAILVADITQARGIAFRAVAVLGLAEGEFPAAVAEDPFLRDADRLWLRDAFALPLERSTETAEAQYFYEAITRPREALLLTRPRIADNGTPWQPSPYWEEVRRRLDVTPLAYTSASRPAPHEAASWPELIETLAAHPEHTAALAWVQRVRSQAWRSVERARGVLAQRLDGPPGDCEGDLTALHSSFSELFGAERLWSASRLESYRSCPFSFFVSTVLKLEPRQPPAEGLDARQLGNIYHCIFEHLYRTVGEGAGLDALLAALPAVAGPILDAAPREQGFRETAWWEQTRLELMEHLAYSLRTLESLGGGYRFSEAERTFGIKGRPGPSLVVCGAAGDSFKLHGLIDRVDRDADGHLRIIDYKTGGPWTFTERALREGKKLQLPLYALAAQDALGLGEVREGFYWHVQHGQRSSLTLSGFRGNEGQGTQAAIAVAQAHAWEVVHSARQGDFIPHPPDGGCPRYCPAAGFCWQYTPGVWG